MILARLRMYIVTIDQVRKLSTNLNTCHIIKCLEKQVRSYMAMYKLHITDADI